VISAYPLPGIGEVKPAADLAALLAAALRDASLVAEEHDVLVVTQKIVSKAENCFVSLNSIKPGSEALRLAALTRKDARLVELVLAESIAVIRAVPNVLITRHRCGFVMANAGIDRSNIGESDEEQVLLLPRDPDASAAALRLAMNRLGIPLRGVIISDSFGRPWRYGVVNVAIGAAGYPALVDRRGQVDRDGRVLEVTQIALADMVASAAGLAMGEGAEGIPAALVRGLPRADGDVPASALIRPVAEDLFQ
jgi:coenzyme F420-0:L-glutamate ligase/coenzyme F420-1:gamma-L-glutamate ligase